MSFDEAAKELEKYLNTSVFLLTLEYPYCNLKDEIVQDVIESAIFDFYRDVLRPEYQIELDTLVRVDDASTVVEETDTERLVELKAVKVIFSKDEAERSYDIIVYYVDGIIIPPGTNDWYSYTMIKNIVIRKGEGT